MLSSSVCLSVSLALSALSSTASATLYKLGDTYAGTTFLDGFDFFTARDPTNGFVKYLDKTTAMNGKQIKMVGTDNYIGVDYNTSLTVAGGVGRGSVRIESKKSYNKGLFIVDIKHMPGGICGTWPAFWSLGSGTWPQTGEIDIIEGVNQNTQNKMVLHTNTTCKTNGTGQTGQQSLYDCDINSLSGASGCDVNAVEQNTFGAGFNTAVGGVYAMEWTSQSIKIWFFPRNKIPASITANAPDTSAFGTPNSNFQGACDIDARFKDHRFIFDNTFCGDWAGNVYGTSSCPQYNLSSMDACKKYVAENPAAFKNSFWQITYFKTFIVNTAVSSSTSTRASSTSTRVSSTSTRVSSTSTSTRVSSTSTSTRVSSTSTSTRVSSTSTRLSTTIVTSTRTSTSASPSATKKVTTDATCGGTGGFTCQGSIFGNCCSSAGWCGSTVAYCGTGCNKNFGTCT